MTSASVRPEASAAITVPEPVVAVPGYDINHPAETVYSEGFESNTGGWTASTNATSLGQTAVTKRTGAFGLAFSYVGAAAEARAIRTVTGLVIGRQYTVSAWFYNATWDGTTKATDIRVGVAGKGLGPSAPLTLNVWVNPQFTFTATATSHDLILAATANGISLQWDDVALTRNAWVETIPPVMTLKPELKISQGKIRLDENYSPYVRASFTVPLTSEEVLEQIDPRADQRVTVKASANGHTEKVYTPWSEQRRNTFTNSLWTTGDVSALYNSSTEAVSGGVLTITAGVNDAPSLFSMLYPVGHPVNTPWSSRMQVRRKPGDSAERPLSIRPVSYLGGSGLSWATVGNGNQTVTLTDEWKDVEFSGYVQGTTATSVGVQFVRTGPWPSGQGFQVRQVIMSPTLVCPLYFAPGLTEEFTRTRWLGVPSNSFSVLETRAIDHVAWVPEDEREYDLSVQSRTVNHKDQTIEIEATSDEIQLHERRRVSMTADNTPRTHEASLRALCSWALGKIGAALESGTDDADLTAQWSVTNLVANPSGEFDTSGAVASNWTVGQFVNGTITAATMVSPPAPSGTRAVGWTSLAGGDSNIIPVQGGNGRTYAVKPGSWYVWSYYICSTASRTARAAIQWWSADGTILSSQVFSSAITTVNTEFRRVHIIAQAPGGTTHAYPYVNVPASAATTHFVDRAMFHEGSELLPYFDGSTATNARYTHAWANAPHGSTSTRTPIGPVRNPSLFDWAPGQSLFEFVQPLLSAAGLRLFCDETRTWRLVDPTDYSVPGYVVAQAGHNVTEGTDSINRVDDTWADAVVVVYTWTGEDGETQTAYDVAGDPDGKTIVRELNHEYPGPGAAQHILNSFTGRGRTQTVTVLGQYDATPGQAVTINLPGTLTQNGSVRAVTVDLASGLMDVETRGLTDVLPGAWAEWDPTETWAEVDPGTTWNEA